LLVSAELIDARTNRNLWGEQYDRKLSDLIGVQQDISGAISARLRERLSGDAAKPVTKGGTNDPEAYQDYLKGEYYFEKRTRDSLAKAKDYFNQAIEKDPGYALAWSGLAADEYVLPGYAPVSNTEAMAKARAAAEKAIALDGTLAEPHGVLAGVHESSYEWDAAEQEYKRAIELNPNHADIHNWYALFLSTEGRHSEAIAEEKRALEIEPLTLKYNDNLALVYQGAGQYEQALTQFRKAVEMDPSYASAYSNITDSNVALHRYDQWLENWKKAATLTGDKDSLEIQEEAARVYAKSGYPAARRRIIEMKLQLAKRSYVDPAEIAYDYAAVGENDQAFLWLDKAYAEKSYGIQQIKPDFAMNALRSDPRYAALLKKMGLPQ
jgi:adenylate cyclase